MSFNPVRPLEGQTAIITGASSGIGAVIALRFAASGAAVGVNFRRNREPADRIIQVTQHGGGDALALEADVSQESAVQRMFARFLHRFGHLDILVANAGIQ